MKQIIKFSGFFLLLLVFTSCKKEKAFVAPLVNNTNDNIPPVADAGQDQTIVLPIDSTVLTGSGTDANGNIVSYEWTKIKGPINGVLQDQLVSPYTAVTKVKNLIEGVYEYELKVKDDEGLSAKDTITITVVRSGGVSNGLRLIPIGVLSVKRYNVATATAGNKIFFAGGYMLTTSDTIPLSSLVDIYDLNTKTWTSANLSEARSSVGAVTVGDKVLFAGGVKNWDGGYWGYFKLSTRVDIYDITTNSWSTTELPEEVNFTFGWDGTCGVAGNKAIFCGSYPLTSPNAYMYDVITNAWTTAPLSISRSDLASASLANKLLIAGSGKNVDVYDAATNSWSVQSLSENRGLLRGAVLNNKAFFAGGGFYPQFTSKVDIYDNNTQTWSVANLSRPTTLAGAAAAGQKMLFISDHRIDIYDAPTETWSFLDITEIFPDDTSVISAGGDVYISTRGAVWRVQF